jgi:hypothetical protein
MHNGIDYELRFFENIPIRKTQNAITALHETLCSRFIVLRVAIFAVLIAVQFDDELCRRAIEVDDVRTDWLLASEPQAGDFARP